MSVESMNASNVAANTQVAQQPQTQQTSRSGEAEVVNKSALSQSESSEKPSQKMTADEVQVVVDKLNEFMQNDQRNLSFSIDKDTEDMVVKVMDTETQEVIRQFPSEETIKLAKHIEGMLGLIFNDHA